MEHALDPDRGDGGALKRRQQHPAKRVAESQPEAALERLGDEGRPAARFSRAWVSRSDLSRCRLLLVQTSECQRRVGSHPDLAAPYEHYAAIGRPPSIASLAS